jgi:hypothetical protein
MTFDVSAALARMRAIEDHDGPCLLTINIDVSYSFPVTIAVDKQPGETALMVAERYTETIKHEAVIELATRPPRLHDIDWTDPEITTQESTQP